MMMLLACSKTSALKQTEYVYVVPNDADLMLMQECKLIDYTQTSLAKCYIQNILEMRKGNKILSNILLLKEKAPKGSL